MTAKSPASPVSEPYQSRFTGRTIEVDLFWGAPKICSLNCVFCSRGETTVRLNQVRREINYISSESLLGGLRTALQTYTEVESVLIAGNGEPTLHPDFASLAQLCVQLVRELSPRTRTWISTNAAHVDSRRMIEALNLFDERIVRLDVGSERVFKQITQPIARVSLDRVVSGARSLRDTWLTAIFFEGAIANLPTTELEEWFELIGMIRPKGIVLRAPRSTSGHIHPVSEDQLDSLAARIERRIQIRPKVFLL